MAEPENSTGDFHFSFAPVGSAAGAGKSAGASRYISATPWPEIEFELAAISFDIPVIETREGDVAPKSKKTTKKLRLTARTRYAEGEWRVTRR